MPTSKAKNEKTSPIVGSHQFNKLKFQKMKKRRWIQSSSPTNPYSQAMSKSDKHLAFVMFSVIFAYLCIMLVIYYIDNHRSYSMSPLERRGLIFDLEKESFHFKVKGFEYFSKSPLKRRPTLTANQVWFLRPLNEGSIQITNLQGQLSKHTQVSILIKYHIPWGSRSKLSVSGINERTHEVTTTELSQYGIGYCTTVVFLGHVNEVLVEGAVITNGAFVIIDKLLVGLGLFVFEGLDEETCS